MAIRGFPGVDSKGAVDPQRNRLSSFADTTARDAWVTSIGGTTALNPGFMCYITGTNAVSVWSGTAWRSITTA